MESQDMKGFNPQLVRLVNSSYSEADRESQQTDEYMVTKIFYADQDEPLFKYSTMTSSDFGGRWGQQHKSELNFDKTQLTIKSFDVDFSYSGSSKGEEKV